MISARLSEVPAVRADNFAAGSFFGLRAEDGVSTRSRRGLMNVGAANLSAFGGLPPFISREPFDVILRAPANSTRQASSGP